VKIFHLLYLFVVPGLALFAVPLFINIPMLTPIFYALGGMIAFMGVFIVQGRAKKTGADKLLEFERPDVIKWFYVYRDYTMKIVDSVRDVGSLYCKELDRHIDNESKSYSIAGHKIKVVPEGYMGIDLDKVLYAEILKSHNFSNIKEAREYVRNNHTLNKNSIDI